MLILLLWLLLCAPGLSQSSTEEVITLNQSKLFPIQSLGEISAADRKQILEDRLNKILTNLQPPFQVESRREGESCVLSCQSQYLVTVTPVDALAARVNVDLLAEQWSNKLEKALYRAYLENSDEYYKYALWNSGWAILLGVVLHPLIRRLCLRYLSTPGFSLRGLLWLGVCAYCLYQFPRTRFLALSLQRYALKPFVLLVIVIIGCAITSWIVRRGLRHYFLQSERIRSRTPQTSPRWRQRLHMMRDATQFVAAILLIVLASIVYFSLLDLNVGAILAGASFLGVGLGFAAQDVLKDYTAGINIMIEDQFGAGDIITVATHTGVVEHFTLRVTQIRDLGGSLITIPNSQIRTVQNLSNLWSQVDLIVPVALDADLRAALATLEETANQLRQDWPDRVLEEAQVLGVESVGAYCVELRMLLRTAPQMQFAVRRELLLRIIEAFRQQKIEIPAQFTRLVPSATSDQVVTNSTPVTPAPTGMLSADKFPGGPKP